MQRTTDASTATPARGSSPFAPPQTYQIRFSLQFLLLMMVVAAFLATIAIIAMRTPEVADEIAAITGREVSVSAGGESSRFTHLLFLIMCYASTLMAALVVQVTSKLVQWIADRRGSVDDRPTDPFAAED